MLDQDDADARPNGSLFQVLAAATQKVDSEFHLWGTAIKNARLLVFRLALGKTKSHLQDNCKDDLEKLRRLAYMIT